MSTIDLDRYWEVTHPGWREPKDLVVTLEEYDVAVIGYAKARRDGNLDLYLRLRPIIRAWRASCEHPEYRIRKLTTVDHLRVDIRPPYVFSESDLITWCDACDSILKVNGLPFDPTQWKRRHIAL